MAVKVPHIKRASSKKTEKELLREVREGSKCALEEIYKRHWLAMYKHAVSVVGSAETAEDVAQDAFTKTIGAISEGKQVSELGSWLHKCVHNIALNAVKHQRLRNHAPLEESLDSAGENGTPEVANLKSRTRMVLRAVSELPIKQRSVFLLTEVHGLNYSQAADELGTSVDSVRQRLFRARQEIREAVGSETAAITAPLLRAYIKLRPDAFTADGTFKDRIANSLNNFSLWLSSLGDRAGTALAMPAAAVVLGAAVVAGLTGGSGGAEGVGAAQQASGEVAVQQGDANSSSGEGSPGSPQGVGDGANTPVSGSLPDGSPAENEKGDSPGGNGRDRGNGNRRGDSPTAQAATAQYTVEDSQGSGSSSGSEGSGSFGDIPLTIAFCTLCWERGSLLDRLRDGKGTFMDRLREGFNELMERVRERVEQFVAGARRRAAVRRVNRDRNLRRLREQAGGRLDVEGLAGDRVVAEIISGGELPATSNGRGRGRSDRGRSHTVPQGSGRVPVTGTQPSPSSPSGSSGTPSVPAPSNGSSEPSQGTPTSTPSPSPDSPFVPGPLQPISGDGPTLPSGGDTTGGDDRSGIGDRLPGGGGRVIRRDGRLRQ